MPARPFVALLLIALTVDAPLRAQSGTAPVYRDATRPTADRVRDLLGRMTLDDKFWQLFMIPGDLDDSTHNYGSGVFGLQISAPPESAARQRQRVHLVPGESKEVTIELAVDQLRMLGRDMRWVVEPGAFRIMIGSSSKDIRLRGEVTVQ